MAAKSSDWRPGPTVCRCCLSEGCYKDISTEYFWMGKREVYSEMLAETFDVSISYSKSGGPNSQSRLICEPCIARLRDAADFKRQVQECEKTFVNCLDPANALNDLQVSLDLDKEVKVEMVMKEEVRLSDDDDDFGDAPDFGDDDDDYDDLDDQPLTKLASKIPKKETVDVLDLLDNAKITEKRKSSSKHKSQPSRKTKQIAGSSKEKPEPKKKKDYSHMAHCINCNIIIPLSQQYIYNTVSMSRDVITIMEEWIAHEVTDEDQVCQECINLLLVELNNRNEGNIGARQFGHKAVCVSCGISIHSRTGRYSRPLPEGHPERAQIMANINSRRQVPANARACNACWQWAHRQVRQLET